MHACGHDCHVAVLMGVAELLAGMKTQLRAASSSFSSPRRKDRRRERKAARH